MHAYYRQLYSNLLKQRAMNYEIKKRNQSDTYLQYRLDCTCEHKNRLRSWRNVTRLSVHWRHLHHKWQHSYSTVFNAVRI